MMLITHASTFLSTALVRTLNQHNFNYLVVTDDDPAWIPPADWRIKEHLSPTPLPGWFEPNQPELEFAFCLDIADDQADDAYFQTLWQQCINYQVPLIFHTTPGRSAWVAQQHTTPFFWAGLSAPPSSEPRDVAQLAYSLVHQRQRSGTYALDLGAAYQFTAPKQE